MLQEHLLPPDLSICRNPAQPASSRSKAVDSDVYRLVSQIEIYDQVWRIRDGDMTVDKNGRICGHSRKAIQLVREFIEILEKIPDGCAELFPFELIDELKEEYLTDS